MSSERKFVHSTKHKHMDQWFSTLFWAGAPLSIIQVPYHPHQIKCRLIILSGLQRSFKFFWFLYFPKKWINVSANMPELVKMLAFIHSPWLGVKLAAFSKCYPGWMSAQWEMLLGKQREAAWSSPTEEKPFQSVAGKSCSSVNSPFSARHKPADGKSQVAAFRTCSKARHLFQQPISSWRSQLVKLQTVSDGGVLDKVKKGSPRQFVWGTAMSVWHKPQVFRMFQTGTLQVSTRLCESLV